MKKYITYIPLGCVILLAFFGYQYASNQATTMRMLVDARVGISSETYGLELLNKNLDVERATVAGKRRAELESNKTALVEASKAREDMESAKNRLENSKSALEEIKEKIADATAKAHEIEEENERMINALHSVPLLANASPEEASGIIEEFVKEIETTYEKFNNDLEGKIAERGKLTSEVSGLQVDLRNREETNTRFMETYRKNGEEFVVSAVDPQWHFVIFNASEDNGFYPGDPTQLLVHRNGVSIANLRIVSVSGGQVVAEYDEESLPRGVRIEVGDRIFRQKPMGS